MSHPGISQHSRNASHNDTAGAENLNKEANETRAFMRKLGRTGTPHGHIEVTVRGLLPEDISYIIDSWVQSYRYSPDIQGVDENLYKVEMRNRVYREISKHTVIVACDPQDIHAIYGWICFIPPTVFGHLPVVLYILVKRTLWKRGIGCGLVDLARASGSDPEGPVWCYDWTMQMRGFADKVGMMRNPFLREAPQGSPPA